MHKAKYITYTGKTVLAALLVTLLSVSTGFAGNYETKIFQFQQKLADNRNPQAQYKLAAMYETGRGTAVDIDKAKSWYQKAAANNYKPARHRLTFLEIKSTGFKSGHKSWFKALSTDAKNGEVEALFLLGEMNEHGIGIKKNLKHALTYYKAASIKGNVSAEYRLYEVEQTLNQTKADDLAKQEAKLAAQETQQRKKEARRIAEQKKSAQSNRQKQAQLKASQEQKQLEVERRRLSEERRKLEAKQKALAKREAEANEKARQMARKEAAKAEGFESDLCSGRAARFRTQCK